MVELKIIYLMLNFINWFIITFKIHFKRMFNKNMLFSNVKVNKYIRNWCFELKRASLNLIGYLRKDETKLEEKICQKGF